MKKILLSIPRIKKQLFLGILFLPSLYASAQDLVFDNSFNSNSYHIDSHDPLYDYYSQTGQIRQLNDSIFLYYENKVNTQTNSVNTRVVSKKVKSDGSVEEVSFFTNGYSLGINGIQQGDYDITDVVTNGTDIYVLRNERYDDNGTYRNQVRIVGYTIQSNGSYIVNNPFGGGVVSVSESGSNLTNARGTMLGDSLIIAYVYNNGGSNQVGSSVITPAGLFNIQVVSNNSPTLHSQVQDVLAVSENSIYIADNAVLFTTTGGNTTCTDVSRVIKWDAENNAFSSDYTGNGTGKSVTMPWNAQSETPIAQDFITKILLENGKIIAAGYTREYDGSPYGIYRGRVTRLNANGTLDNTFANNGTFNQGFTTSYFRWQFNDIDISPSGTYYLSGQGNVSSPSDPSQSFILSINNLGTVNTTYGNNGFLYETTDAFSISSTCILPGNAELENKFMIYGAESTDGGMFLGRLIWNATAGIETTDSEMLSIYPNPASENLTIESALTQEIRIFNALGTFIQSQQLEPESVTFSINHLKNGIYFIQTASGATQKFIKQ